MIDTHHGKVDLQHSNEVIDKIVNLDSGLDAFILIDSEDSKISTIVLNSILDALIGNISRDDTYKHFSGALENINAIFKTWQNEGDKIKWLHIFIWILSKKNLIFSTMGQPVWFLVKRDGEVIDVVDTSDHGKREFNFISSGEVNEWEVLIVGSNTWLAELSKSDLRESVLSESSENISKNIVTILSGENLEKNVGIFVIKNDYFAPPKEDTKFTHIFSNTKHFWMKLLDNKPIKKFVAMMMIWKEKLEAQWQLIKWWVLLGGIVVSIFLLYSIIGWLLSSTSTSRDVENSRELLTQAKEYIRLANENIANPDVFELNIQKAEENVYQIQDKQLFLNDINKILEDISIIKKQFNGVEVFDNSDDKLVTNTLPESALRVLENNGKTYIITKNSVIWPILPNVEPKTYTFDALDASDSFKDAAFVGEDIVILTSLSKVVNFSRSGFLQYADVIGQKIWQESSEVDSFASNIYLLNKERNQIFKHRKTGANFETGTPYLKPEDATALWKILAVGIDGWIYMLKDNLTLYKVFASPKYRLESIILNKLPKNYDIEWNVENIKIKTRWELSYFYMLLNDKIWVFQPNTTRFQDTKSLTYIGQVEAKNGTIKDFFVAHDGELLVLTDSGLYTMKFEVSNDKLIMR